MAQTDARTETEAQALAKEFAGYSAFPATVRGLDASAEGLDRG